MWLLTQHASAYCRIGVELDDVVNSLDRLPTCHLVR